MICALGNAHRLLSRVDSLRELSALGKRPNQIDPGENRDQPGLAEPLADQLALQGLEVGLEKRLRPTEVSPVVADLSQAQSCHDLEREVLTSLGDGKGAITRLHRAVEITRYPEIVRQGGRDPSQPALIVDPHGEHLAFAEVVEDFPEFSKVVERISEVQSEIDTLLDRFSTLGEMCEGCERLFEARSRFPIGRAPGRLGAGLTEVASGLVPYLP